MSDNPYITTEIEARLALVPADRLSDLSREELIADALALRKQLGVLARRVAALARENKHYRLARNAAIQIAETALTELETKK